MPHTFRAKLPQLLRSRQPPPLLHGASAPELERAPAVTLEDFELLFVLGEGGAGKVWQCIHKATRTTYAIKIIEKSSIVSAGSIARLIAERTIMSSLESHFITKLHFAFQGETQVYFVLELAAGGDLLRVLRSYPRHLMPEEDARFYLAELVLAIEHIHASGVSFRDLKPENVLVTAQGHLKVADFGLATKRTAADRSTTLCGTPEYMAPEMLKEQGHGPMVDVWALGCMAYEFLQGQPPFTGGMHEMFVDVLANKPYFKVPVSVEAADLIAALLRKEPTKRLGAGGIDEIKRHSFFMRVDWIAMSQHKAATPPMRPRALATGPAQVESAALLARIRADFEPFTSVLHSPPSSTRTLLRTPSPLDLTVLGDLAFRSNCAVVILDGATRHIRQRDERLQQVTGLTPGRILFDEALVSGIPALHAAIARVLIVRTGSASSTCASASPPAAPSQICAPPRISM